MASRRGQWLRLRLRLPGRPAPAARFEHVLAMFRAAITD
jgi:hypothetical protein